MDKRIIKLQRVFFCAGYFAAMRTAGMLTDDNARPTMQKALAELDALAAFTEFKQESST